jgi:hypothetical protein
MNNNPFSLLFQLLLTSFVVYFFVVPQIHAQSNVLTIPPGSYADEAKKEFQAMNVPINFYGIAINQDGKPLSGVKIVMSVQQPYFDPIYVAKAHYPHFQRTTASDGRFSLDGVVGKNVEIESMTKQGYEAEPNVKHVYGPVGGSFDDPMTFKMWREDIRSPLIMEHKAFHVTPDGTPHVIDLTRGTITHSNDQVGDLRICIKMGTLISNRDFDWSLEIRALNGGLIEERELSSPMFRAPQDGYTNVFSISHSIGDQIGRSEGKFRFFLRLKDGAEFGRFSVDMSDYLRLPKLGPLHIDYAINPSGSPVLRP